jgi:hypothetical protein
MTGNMLFRDILAQAGKYLARMIRTETGQALPIVLACVALGSLVVGPFLVHSSTSLTSSRYYGQILKDSYSADAGIEHAIWRLTNSNLASQIPNTGDLIAYNVSDQINSLLPNVTVMNGGNSGNNIVNYHIQSHSGETNILASIDVSDGGANVLSWQRSNLSGYNLIPTVTSIYPANKYIGDAGFTLNVSGTNFISGSVIQINRSNRATTYVSGSQLSATILASDLISHGIFPITVVNPSPGGGISNSRFLMVNSSSEMVCFTSVPDSFSGSSASGIVTSNNAQTLSIRYTVGNNGHDTSGTLNCSIKNKLLSSTTIQTVTITVSANSNLLSNLKVDTDGIIGTKHLQNFNQQQTQIYTVGNTIDSGQQASLSLALSTPKHSKGSYSVVLNYTCQ